MIPCTEHPAILETEPCAGCGRPFCAHCLAEITGRRLCHACKVYAVQDLVRPGQRHPLALWSVLVPAIGYLFGCTIPVTSGIGLYLSWKVLRETEQEPHLSGRSAGLAGMVISAGSLGTLVLAAVVAVVLQLTRR